jgi:hypothetical protein
LPKEYLFALSGIGLMMLGGLGDMIWHIIFGIENNMDALFSPTHILLAVGGAIGVAGPLYAVWYRDRVFKIHSIPTVLSTLYFLSIFTFMLQYLHPLSHPWVAQSFITLNPIAEDFGIMLGAAAILGFTVMYMGVLLSTVRHYTYKFGSMTAIFGLNAVLMTLMYEAYFQFIITGFVAGFIIDVLYMKLIKENSHRMSSIHLFSFLAPFVYTGVFMATIYATDSFAWTIHTWTGLIFISGIVGYLLSNLILPARE